MLDIYTFLNIEIYMIHNKQFLRFILNSMFKIHTGDARISFRNIF